MTRTATLCVLGAFVAFLVRRLARIGRREDGLPNGPATVPILGNLNIFPRTQAYLRFTEWARIYGGIYSLKIGPLNVLVLTDLAVVKELMEKRSQTTIDRPPMYGADLVTGGMHLALARYGKKWRVQRRIVQETLTLKACDKHCPIQRAESMQLVYDCLTQSSKICDHINRYSFSVILSILFGKRTPRPDTQEMLDFFKMEESWQKVLAPGFVPPVELLPFLKYLPRFLAPWKGECDTARYLQHKLYYGFLQETQERMAQGHQNGCFMEQVISRKTTYGLSDTEVGYLGGTMIEAGGDTTAAWLKVLVLALIAYPQVQKEAHGELDNIVGWERMPALEDLPRLPYIQAIIKEVHRWRPVGPLGVPHATTEELNYAGYRIPVGTTIFNNVWGMSHDPEIYERPEDFWPDRWVIHEFGAKPGAKHGGLNPNWFGSGRRVCPGSHLANNSLAINTMNLLWSFNFTPELDLETGKPVKVDVFDFEEGLATTPRPFICNIAPRSFHHGQVIEHEFAAARGIMEQYEHGLSAEDEEYVRSQCK